MVYGESRRKRKGDTKERSCLGCQRIIHKRFLLRITRYAYGKIGVDLAQKGHGRSAYVCPIWDCLLSAFKRRRLAQALRLPSLTRLEEITVFQQLAKIAFMGTGDKKTLS